MVEASWVLFVVASLALIVTPGQDIILVMSRSMTQGAAAGVVTAAGVSVGLGIVAAVVLANLVRQLGAKDAFELVSLGEAIDGARAKEMRLCNCVCADSEVLDVAIDLATRLAARSPIAMTTTKRVFHRVRDQSLEGALAIGRDANVMMRAFRKPGK